jgi:glutathione S-transferase
LGAALQVARARCALDARRNWLRFWALEAAISFVDYLVGNRFSAADLYVGAQIGFGMMFGTLDRRPAFERYWQRMSARPAYTRATKLDDEKAAELKKASG